jgi:hypothetical protein
LGNGLGNGYYRNSGDLQTADLSGIAQAQNTASTLTFRLYLWHAGASTTVGLGKITDYDYNLDKIEDVSIIGSVQTVSGKPDIMVSRSTVSINEGTSENITVWLSESPVSGVSVSVSRQSGDSDISVTAGASLLFTTSNWNVPQTVTLSAAVDADLLNGSAIFQLSGPGLVSNTIAASEVEKNRRDIIIEGHNAYDWILNPPDKPGTNTGNDTIRFDGLKQTIDYTLTPLVPPSN